MALIKCHECQTEVSTEAAACPRCGAPVQKPKIPPKQYSTKYGCLIVLGIIVMLGMCTVLFEKTEDDWASRDSSTMAYVQMETFVKARLKSPATAQFPDEGPRSHVRHLDGQSYLISSWVDSQNSFGALVRTRFVGRIQQTSLGQWKLLDLVFETQ